MRSPTTVLLLDHRGTGLAQRLAALGRDGWRLESCETVRRSLERLAGPPPSAIVLDPLVEGGAQELEALDRAGASAVPLLLLSDPARVGLALDVLGREPARVADLAHRDAEPEEIRARLERLLSEAAARAELLELRHRALYDDRTELLRPEAFERRLAEHWSAAERHGHELALVVLDLDRFGQFNKRYDHTVGDRVLSRVSAAIRSALRTEDVAGRLGGDEFGCVLPYTKKADAARVVQRLRERIRAVSGRVDGLDLDISASLGFETFDGRDLESVDVLRRHAESALREAKRRGGDRALYYRLLPPAG
ncbi:MAG: GGDEF domain-containing protein [Planctomycetes bacterium]|nr:GGDEF domain-containing protein [Planctomycetota bacterium]